jgi:AsmA protein
MQDNNAFKLFSMQFNLQANADSADLSNINITLDDTHLTGSASVRNFKHPAYTFNLDIDAINLDRYLPDQQQPAASTKSGSPTQAANTPAVAVAAGATLIPVDALKKLNAKGQLTIGKLRVSKTNMQGVRVNLSATKGIIKTEQSINDLYKGKYTGSINIDVTRKQPSLSLNEKITQLQIQPLLKDRNSKIRMTGTASGSAKLQARGNKIEDIKSSLSGLVSFGFNNGVIKGFNLQNIIKNSISLIEGKPLPKSNYNDQTQYSTIRGSIHFINGIALNDDLLAKAPDLRVTGKGKAYLTTEKLDYQIIGRLLKSEATATEPEKIEGIPVRIIIGGTFSEPVYAPDIIAMLKDKSNPEIEKKKQKLLDKVDKKFGSDVKNILKQFF